MSAPLLLAIDQGTTSTRSIVFRTDLSVAAVAQEEVPPALSIFGLGRARSRGSVAHDTVHDARRNRQGRCRRRTDCCRRHRQSARNDATLGSQDRQINRQRHRLARPAHGRYLRADEKRGAGGVRHRADGVGARSLFFRPPRSPGCSTMFPARALRPNGETWRFGTIDTFLLWRLTGGRLHATDATNAARTALFDIHRGEWDEELCRRFAVPVSILPKVMDCAADYGTTEAEILGAPVAIRGNGWRSACGHGRPSLLHARHGQDHLWYRLLRGSQYGRGARGIEKSSVDHHRLSTRGQAHLCARRRDLRRGRCGCNGCAMDSASSRLRMNRAHWLPRPMVSRMSIWCRPSSVWGAPYWDAEARGCAVRIDTRNGTERARPRGAGKRRLPTRDLVEAMHADLAAFRRYGFCGSMAG